MSYLVDTNIVSELARRTPNQGVIEWARGVSKISLSAVALEELVFGLSWKPNSRVQAWFDKFLSRDCQILIVTEVIARRAGQLRGQLMAIGQSRTQADMLIAATAAVHGLTIVTRNVDDFEGCGVPVLNPFSNQR